MDSGYRKTSFKNLEDAIDFMESEEWLNAATIQSLRQKFADRRTNPSMSTVDFTFWQPVDHARRKTEAPPPKVNEEALRP